MSQITILIVEDNNLNQKLIQSMLKKLGYACETAENGKVAVDLCNVKKFSLILMDCQMPIMDGFMATKQILSDSQFNKSTPIIAVTANTTPHDQANCINAGMHDFISKPIEMQNLISTIIKWISK